MSEKTLTTAQERLANFEQAKADQAEEEYAKAAYGDAGVNDLSENAKKRLEDQVAFESYMQKFESDDRDSLDRHLDAVDSGEIQSKDDARLRFMARLALEIEQMENSGDDLRIINENGRTILDDKKDRLQVLQDEYARGVVHEKPSKNKEGVDSSEAQPSESIENNTLPTSSEQSDTTDGSTPDVAATAESKERLKDDRYPVGRIVYVSGRAQRKDSGEVSSEEPGFRPYVVAARTADGEQMYLMSPRGELMRIGREKLNMLYEAAKAKNEQPDDYSDQEWIDSVKTIRKPLLTEDKSKPGQYKVNVKEWEIVDPHTDNPFLQIRRDDKVELIHKGIANLWKQLEQFQKAYDADKAIDEIKKLGGLPNRNKAVDTAEKIENTTESLPPTTLEQLKFGLKKLIERDKEFGEKYETAIMGRLGKSIAARRAKVESMRMKANIREKYADKETSDRSSIVSKLKTYFMKDDITALTRERDARLKKRR